MTSEETHNARYRKVSIAFLIVAIVIVGFILSIVFARADIIVLAKPEDISGEVVVNVSNQPKGGEITGEFFQKTVSLTQQFAATGVVTSSSDGSAVRELSIASTLSRPQPLVVRTRIQARDGTLFRLSSSVVVPAKGTVTVSVAPDNPTVALSDYQTTTWTIPGLPVDQQKFFSVSVFSPDTSSSNSLPITDQSRRVSQQDSDQALSILENDLVEQAQNDARQSLQNKNLRGVAVVTQAIKKITDPVGTKEDTFFASETLKVQMIFYDGQIAASLLTDRLNALAPSDRQVSPVNQNSITTKVDAITMRDNTGRIRLSGKSTSRIAPSAPPLRTEKVTGIRPESAKRYLEQVDGIASVSIRIHPFWITQMPSDPKRITVIVR